MKNTKRLIIIALTVIAIIALGIIDLIDSGKLTTGFIGLCLLLCGSILIPELFKKKSS
ncbi:MAG TPA: hypothetical protein PLU33_11175 [Treponemataceae bacterium]|nr:hypothetical protein [Treponemataceae bacterium]HQL05691.1 hypothetical protein [Treponemataceae bacterium]